MYRKEQQRRQKMEEDKQAFTRVSNYPVVKDTWNKMSEVYQRGKDGSRILRLCGNVAESGASLAYKASMPVIERLPVDMVNDYAVQKLEVLEEKYPALVKPTDEVVGDLKAYSTSKLDEMKAYGTDKFNRLAELAHLNSVLDVADAVVDRFLPAVEPAQPQDEATPQPVVELPAEASTRVRMISDKVRRRAYQNAMAKAGTIQKRSLEAVEKLMYTVDLIDYAQQNIRNTKLEDVQEKVKSVYEEITSAGDENESLPAEANLEKKAIFVARSLTRRTRSTFGTISRLSCALPAYARSAVNDAYTQAENIYQAFNKASSYKDFSQQMLTQLREKLSFLEDVASNLSKYVLESTPIRWLASSATESSVPAVIDSQQTDQEQSMPEGH